MKLEIDDKNINELQVESIIRLIDSLKRSTTTDIVVWKGGKEVRFEGDWLKWLKFPPLPKIGP